MFAWIIFLLYVWRDLIFAKCLHAEPKLEVADSLSQKLSIINLLAWFSSADFSGCFLWRFWYYKPVTVTGDLQKLWLFSSFIGNLLVIAIAVNWLHSFITQCKKKKKTDKLMFYSNGWCVLVTFLSVLFFLHLLPHDVDESEFGSKRWQQQNK